MEITDEEGVSLPRIGISLNVRRSSIYEPSVLLAARKVYVISRMIFRSIRRIDPITPSLMTQLLDSGKDVFRFDHRPDAVLHVAHDALLVYDEGGTHDPLPQAIAAVPL